MQKTILGWCLDTRAMTLMLSPHWAAWLQELLDAIPRHHLQIAAKRWHQLLGELCSMVLCQAATASSTLCKKPSDKATCNTSCN